MFFSFSLESQLFLLKLPSFCYLHTKRHKPPPRLQRQPRDRVGGAGGDDLKYNDGKGRDVYHFAYTL